MDNDNEITDGLPKDLVLDESFGDPLSLWNSRKWLEDACKAKGAIVTGGGCGMGEADIDIKLEGHGYYLTIRPILR